MLEPHAFLNVLDAAAAAQALRRCCGSERWVAALLERRPYASTAQLQALGEQVWQTLCVEDQLEAFSQHPQIGQDLEALRRRFAGTHALSAREQAGVSGADEETLSALRDGNRAYRARFGFIFIVCATGKSAGEMLALLRQRLQNGSGVEFAIAAREHAQILRLRLEGLGR